MKHWLPPSNFRCPVGSSVLCKCSFSAHWPEAASSPSARAHKQLSIIPHRYWAHRSCHLNWPAAKCPCIVFDHGGGNSKITTSPQHVANLSCSLDRKTMNGCDNRSGWTPGVIRQPGHDRMGCLSVWCWVGVPRVLRVHYTYSWCVCLRLSTFCCLWQWEFPVTLKSKAVCYSEGQGVLAVLSTQ